MPLKPILNPLVMYGARRPYRRSMYPATRYKKRRYGGKRAPKRAGMRRIAPANFAAKVRQVIKPESKFLFAETVAANVILNIPVVVPITNTLGQGVGASTRIGNWIQPTALYGHITLQGASAAEFPVDFIRCVIIQYNDDQAAAPFDPDVLLESATAPGGPWKVTSKGIFTVLWSSYFTITNDQANLAFTRTIPFDIKMQKRPRVLYDSATAKKGQLFFICMSTKLVVPAPYPLCSTQIQLRYTDS